MLMVLKECTKYAMRSPLAQYQCSALCCLFTSSLQVAFEEQLNIEPFITSECKDQCKEKGWCCDILLNLNLLPLPGSLEPYHLFAVLVHQGPHCYHLACSADGGWFRDIYSRWALHCIYQDK